MNLQKFQLNMTEIQNYEIMIQVQRLGVKNLPTSFYHETSLCCKCKGNWVYPTVFPSLSNTKDTLKLTNSNQKLPQDETHTPTHLLQHQARRDLHGTHTSTR